MHEYLLVLEQVEREGIVGDHAKVMAMFDRVVYEIKANTFGLVLMQ